MAKELRDIKAKEISLVNSPANQREFLFWKQNNKEISSLLKQEGKLNINIESDGTASGTKVTINDKDLGELLNFNFSFYRHSDKDSPVDCSYSKIVEREGGFKRTETFYLSKGDNPMDPKLEKLLKSFIGDDTVKLKKAKYDDETIAHIEKALTTVTAYKDDFPGDLSEAVVVLATHASQGFQEAKVAKDDKSDDDVKKAGAKFSKKTLNVLNSLIKAAEQLRGLLTDGTTKKSTDDDDDADADDDDSQASEGVEKLTKAIATMADDVKKIKDDTATGEQLEKLGKRIDAVEKGTGVRKSVDDQDDDGEDDNDDKAKWPSLSKRK